MIDRTAEDIRQDGRITALESQIRDFSALLTTTASAIDALSARLAPLEGLADELKKIQDFFASIGKK